MAHDPARGKRIREAISQNKVRKIHALAAELEVSVAAVSRWQNGGHASLESVCSLAEVLDVSLDWLLLGRERWTGTATGRFPRRSCKGS